MIRHLVCWVQRLDLGLAARLTSVHLASGAIVDRLLSCQAIIEAVFGQLVVVHHTVHKIVFLNGELGRRGLCNLWRPIFTRTEPFLLELLLLLFQLVGFLYAFHVFLHTDVAGCRSGGLLASCRNLIVQLRLEREVLIVQLLLHFALISYLLFSFFKLLPFLRALNYGVSRATNTVNLFIDLLLNRQAVVNEVVLLVFSVAQLTVVATLTTRILLGTESRRSQF